MWEIESFRNCFRKECWAPFELEMLETVLCCFIFSYNSFIKWKSEKNTIIKYGFSINGHKNYNSAKYVFILICIIEKFVMSIARYIFGNWCELFIKVGLQKLWTFIILVVILFKNVFYKFTGTAFGQPSHIYQFLIVEKSQKYTRKNIKAHE